MAVFRVKLRDIDKTPVNLPTDEPHLIIVTRDKAYRLEVADVHFNFDSAVFLPDAGAEQTSDPAPQTADSPSQPSDPPITGLHVLKACLQYAQAHPEQPVVIAGHTDTVGTPGYNLTLSSLRAQNVQAALIGKRDDWVSSAAAKHCVADYQRILTFTADSLGWDCDPGGVDNKGGPKTAQAVKNFQARYNDEFQASIDVDGGVGPQTWGAFFDVSMRELRALLDTDDAGLQALQQGVTFVDPQHAAVGCGENHPIEAPDQDQFRSATNRRVEVLFFNPGDVPTFPCHPDDRTCQPAACPIYRLKHFTFDPLPVDVEPVPQPIAAARPRSLASYQRSFPKPSLIPTLRKLANRLAADPTLSVLVMGHTDATGDDDADHAVSLARANAVQAFLSKDVDFFRNKFSESDSPDTWGWEEIQWMLSGLQDPSGSPLYGGRMDGHRGDVTMAAVQAFKIVNWTAAPFHRHVDDATLAAIISAYLDLVGDTATSADRIQVAGGGSWHPPREFGSGGAPLQDDYYQSNDLPDFRRVEFFVFGKPLQPSTAACPAQSHDNCAAYYKWCDQTVEHFEQDPDWDALVTVVDADNIPLAGASVSLTRVLDGETVGTATTSDSGIASLKADRDLYVVSADYQGELCASTLDLRVPDADGGAMIRIDYSVHWPSDPSEGDATPDDPDGGGPDQ
jgi:outer membrane protein OmpA-like peptidoglycan-associated protein